VTTTLKRMADVLTAVQAAPGITPARLHEIGTLEIKRQHLYVLLSQMTQKSLLLRLADAGYVTTTYGFEVLRAWKLLREVSNGQRGRKSRRRPRPEAHA
jgi:hypothetical protein